MEFKNTDKVQKQLLLNIKDLSISEQQQPLKQQIANNKTITLNNQRELNDDYHQVDDYDKNDQNIDELKSLNEKLNDNELDQKAIKRQNLIHQGLSYLQHIKVKDVCSNHFAAHFLSEDGCVYSYGKDLKKYGILGLGSVYELQQPQLNTNLQDLKIVKLSMGLSHCCALTASGQLYSWGTGLNGQLCHPDDTIFSNIPKLVQCSSKSNIIVSQIHCSSYYTLIINSKGRLCMFGTLKGFAKFLFDSPSKEVNKSNGSIIDPHNNSDQSNSVVSDRVVRKFKLKLGKLEQVTSVALAEKQFSVYCQETHNLYCVNENFEPELILNRELKSFQYISGYKHLVAQDSDNNLILMSLKDEFIQLNGECQNNKWQIEKEFNLTKMFGTQDIEMTPLEFTSQSKKIQPHQMLSFTVNQKPIKKTPQVATFNKHYYKSFLNSNNPNQNQTQNSQFFQSNQNKSNNMFQVSSGRNANNQMNYPVQQNQKTFINSNYDHENSTMSDSKYNSIYQTKTRNKLKLKIDSIFGETFSARKNRSTSTSIKERAKKLHQSLSPIQRFPIINNLCELIKQQQKMSGANQINMSNVNGNQITAQSPARFGTNLFTQSVNDNPFTFDNMNKKYQDQIKSPQYNLFLQSLNLACQLSSLVNANNDSGLRQSQKQLQFLSKADKIRQELSKKQTAQQQHSHIQNHVTMQSNIVNYDSVNRNNQTNGSTNLRGHFDMIELASPETSRNDQVNNMPLQMDNSKITQSDNQISNSQQQSSKKNQDMPLQTLSVQSSHNDLGQKLAQTLSCIYEDRETSTMIQNQQTSDKRENYQVQRKPNQRQPSLNIPDYPRKLLDSQKRQSYECNQVLNMDTISDISGLQARDFSMNRISQYGGASDLTNTNNYKILVMNARNVIEKKVLQHLMVGFMAIKYYQNNTFQSFRLQSSINYSQKSLNFNEDDRLEQGLNILSKILNDNCQNNIVESFQCVKDFAYLQRERKRTFKKISSLLKQKEEQMIVDAMRKIQLSIRYKKLQRLNMNLLFNCFGKILKRQNKQDIINCFNEIQIFSKEQRKIKAVEYITSLLYRKQCKNALLLLKQYSDKIISLTKAFKLMKKTHSSIQYRRNLNQKSQALYLFKKNVINFQISRSEQLQTILQNLEKKKFFKNWHQTLLKRKAAVQQAIFLKMFISDKIKQTKYYAIVKLINYSHQESQSQTKKSCLNKSNQQQNHQQTQFEEVVSQVDNVTRKLEFAEKSIQNDDNCQELDIEETQLDDGDYYYLNKELSKQSSYKNKDLPLKKNSGKEFSFEKYENINGAEFYQGQDNNMTAHFNRFNLMSKAKDSNNQLMSHSGFKEQRPHYHCHYANEEKVAPEAFTLDPSSNTRNSLSLINGHSREPSHTAVRLSIPQQLQDKTNNYTEHKRELQLQLSQASKMRMSIQDEISPTNNIKNYQRQANLNKNYEQSDPFELPVNDDEYEEERGCFPQLQLDFNQEYKHFIDNNLEHSNIADDGMIKNDPLYIDPHTLQQLSQQQQQQVLNYQPRYSFKNVVPFNSSDDTPSDNYLRQQNYQKQQQSVQQQQQHTKPQNSVNQSFNKHQVFDSKKGSNASSLVNSQANSQKGTFINNYFSKLSAQNSAKNENKNQQNQMQQPKQTLTLFSQNQNVSSIKNKENQMNGFPPQSNGQISSHYSSQQQYMYQNSHPLTQQSFVTNNNNIDIMHFNSHSDNTSFVFFDDNFWRESGISSASRVSNLGRLGPLVNQSFGQSVHNGTFQHQQQLMNRLARQTVNNTNIGGGFIGNLTQNMQYGLTQQQQQQQMTKSYQFNQGSYNLHEEDPLNSGGRYNQTTNQ